jgi:SAM-dependent methyltransferase
MPMSQTDVRNHYERQWRELGGAARDNAGLGYSSPIEDRVVATIYPEFVRDLRLALDGAAILDVGCGSGRWVRNFLDWFRPSRLLGIDATKSSPALLSRWCQAPESCRLEFREADITTPDLDLEEQFELINVANVLFHIPEEPLFLQALTNLKAHLAETGCIITTEYLPRASLRTEWMLVRSRYVFEQAVASVGLRIADVRAFGFFANDPMGVDAPNTRAHFLRVKASIQRLLQVSQDRGTQDFLTSLFSDIEHALLGFCQERIAAVDLPSQKLVALTHA